MERFYFKSNKLAPSDPNNLYSKLRILMLSTGFTILAVFIGCGRDDLMTPPGETEPVALFVLTDSAAGLPGTYTIYLDGEELSPIAVAGDSIQEPDGSYLIIDEYAGLLYPRWDPAGKNVVCEYQGAFDVSFLVLMKADGSRKRFLPVRGGAGSRPQWSPVGDRILFSRQAFGSTVATGIIDTSGANDRDFELAGDPPRIFDEDTIWFHGDYQWGPTGDVIYATASVNLRPGSYGDSLDNEIFSLDVESGKILARLTRNDIDESGFKVSPDGKYVAFKRGKYQQPSVFTILSLTDGDTTNVPLQSYVDFSWNWSSDSKTIIFSLDENEDPYRTDYFIYTIDTHSPFKLTRITPFKAKQPDLYAGK